METPVAFRIGDQAAAFLVVFSAFGIEFVMGLGEVVVVDEIVAGVVRRVDVDELDFAGVVLAKELDAVVLMFMTGVPNVVLNYGSDHPINID